VIASIMRAQKQKAPAEIAKIAEDLVPPSVVSHQALSIGQSGPSAPPTAPITATPPRVVVADLGDWDL